MIAKISNLCYYKLMNIFKTFDIFLREPLSILRERIIQIVSVNSDLVTQASVNVELLDKKAQITIINSEKMYKLCQTVMHKQQSQSTQKLLPVKRSPQDTSGQMILGKMFGRM